MRFSVLLPTRNRLDLLRLAVETVLRQDYPDWEIVISDNASEEDVAGYVRSLGEERIRYHRTNHFVPVTDNWNNALSHCTGDHVIMLGDDDGLLPGFFSAICNLVRDHGPADFVYQSALLYAYPGVMPWAPEGFLQEYGYADFLRSAEGPCWLEPARARELVEKSIAFRVRFGFNMQFATVSRAMIDRLARYGPFYQSPYPDYYAMNALFLKGERILVCPTPLVTIGVSPKSFGYYYSNDRESAGVDFLGNLPDADLAERLKDVLLPGTNMNTSWLFAMESLRENFGTEMPLRVHYSRYRLLQLVHMLRRVCTTPGRSRFAWRAIGPHLRGWEKAVYGPASLLIALAIGPLRVPHRMHVFDRLQQALGTYPPYSPGHLPGTYRNVVEVFERFPQGQGRTSATSRSGAQKCT